MMKKESEVYAEAEEWERQKEIETKMVFVEREEQFQERMLNKKLQSMDNLSNAILQLAYAMANSARNSPVINIYAGNTPVEEMKQIVSNVLEPITTK